MREILFRGKRVDNGKWIEGSLSTEYYKECGCVMVSPTSDDCFKVDPETVGQYTESTDKNGTMIFEGDIVRTKKYGRIIKLKDHTYTNVSDYDTFVVCYSPCMFRLLREKPDRGFNLVNDGYAQLEVIGNIHDNPELLE